MVHPRLGFLRIPRQERRLLLGVCGGITAIVIAVFWRPLSFQSPPAQRGFVLKTGVDSQGKKYHYMVFVPYDYQPGQERPLLLFLHGAGENGTDGLLAVSNNFGPQVWEMKRSFPFVAAIPQCRPGESWTGSEAGRAMAVLDRVAQDYGTDPDRVYVTGVSAGGAGVWSLVQRYPGRFAAAVPLCGMSRVNAEGLVRQGLPIWYFYNAGDETNVVEGSRITHQQLLTAGASPIVTEYPQTGHDCWSLGYQSAGMYAWLLEQSLSKNARRRQPFHIISPEDLLASWQVRGSATWAADEGQTLACRITASGSPGMIVSDAAYRACEMHLDVFLDPERPDCQLKLVTSGAQDAYTLHVPMADAGSGGLHDSQGRWLALLDPAAQRQLRADSWNDLRLAWDRNRITARINGWKAIDVTPEGAEDRTFHVAIVAPQKSPKTRWRNVRLCGEAGETR